ncbi:hypothetical protein UCRPA7_8690 [Phaeoacremonium minimum UCRPA7]|uniref:Uncharacterized protein n=1 Tax=Phaeoacremonium minimum (strain UCR-PA7) TaxID=1286976 RepID=R8B956_PHAM7|nr:hypothetical protein UCRPA7_8690 [Phaeoacremonium minimum UCRPA7]EON95817.1 hypothetical protein UCRPA7_8690 [Phaeoacremonium minimum UCRPA7]
MGSKSSSVSEEGANNTGEQPKKSLYRRYEDAKSGRNNEISDEDMKKYTGKTRDELNTWAKTAPDVAGNQVAGKIDTGPASGLGGAAAAGGYGGWGYEAGARAKYPPQQRNDGKAKDQDSD